MLEQQIQRHRTALTRHEISRPLRLALNDGLVSPSVSVFDYGCGRGSDVRLLRRREIYCDGWDPAHRPDAQKRPADVVNLGYVVNVIENLRERLDTLRDAWGLAGKVLIVSAQLTSDARGLKLRPHADGFVTGSGTFQKYFEQQELRDWIETALNSTPFAAAPGVYYVFRDKELQEEFAASRYRRVRAAPRVRQSDKLFAEHQETLAPLVAFLNERGRLPGPEELPNEAAILEVFGSLRRAGLILRRVLDPRAWESIREERAEDLLTYLALSRFSRRPKLSLLPRAMQLDVKAFFSTYKRATRLADELLYSIGDMEVVDAACRASPLGKLMPTALYVHKTALACLPPSLRVYEGCAQNYLGDVDDTNIIKLNRVEPKVSYLAYPDFETDPHPALALSVSVRLQTFRVRERRFSESTNPPILHRKDELVDESHPLKGKFSRLTSQEGRFGLFDETATIGTREGWEAQLSDKGVELRGHRVVRSRA